MKKTLILWVLIVICILLTVGSVGFYIMTYLDHTISDDPIYFGVFGDYIGGVVGTILTLLSVGLLYLTYTSQMQIAYKQNNLTTHQQFEETFFELLNSLQLITKDTYHELNDVYQKLKQSSEEFEYEDNLLSRENICILQQRVNDMFYDVYYPNRLKIGVYFRNLCHVMQFIEQSQEQDKLKYFQILQAHMCDQELLVLFFYSISQLGKKSIYPMIDKWKFLNVLEADSKMMLKLVSLFYPNTKFKILERRTRNIVFLGGVHGVGKTSFCGILNSRYKNLKYLSASQILNWSDPTIKVVENVDNNQEVLLQKLQKVVSYDYCYLLDGHFCLYNKDMLLQDIDIHVFEQLNPAFIILLERNVDMIHEQLMKRDKKTFSRDQIIQMMDRERSNAEKISKQFDIPLFVIENNELSEELKAYIEDWLY